TGPSPPRSPRRASSTTPRITTSSIWPRTPMATAASEEPESAAHDPELRQRPVHPGAPRRDDRGEPGADGGPGPPQSRSRVPAFKTSDYAAMIEGVRPGLEALERVILLGSPEWDSLIAGAASVPAEALRERMAGLQFDDPINIQYTSGTTGFPKGATLSHHNILNNGFFIGERLGYSERDRVCIPVPFYHCFGMVLGNLACTTHGACMVVPAEAFEPVATMETVQAERCTALYGVPTMFIAELEHPDFSTFDFSSLRTGIMAGS